MQNRYAGDIGDFSKFLLLKKIFGNEKIGLNWYLYPDESHNDDGKHIYYQYENDFKISEKLTKVAISKTRTIKHLEDSVKDVFDDIIYFDKCIEPNKNLSREQYRKKWFEESLKFFEQNNRNVIFVDPDNGLQVKSIPTIGRKKAGKYIFYDEIKKTLDLQSIDTLIIYQHYRRVKNFKETILDELKQKLSNSIKTRNIYALSFHKLSARVYIIISKKNLEENIKQFISDNKDWRF